MKVKLNNGERVPIIGFGVYKIVPGKQTQQAVLDALEAGYRHIDTASRYRNEDDVGIAIKKSGIPREDVFITTKLWMDDHNDPLKAFDTSLGKLGMDYVDLYLMHWPAAGRVEVWKAMEKILESGRCRSIGVSNFLVRHLEDLLQHTSVIPVVNQIEFNPFLFERDILNFCKSKNISVEAYSPLTHGQKLNDPRIAEIAAKHNKSPAQVMLRWSIQHGVIVIPKSVHKERIAENINIFDFSLSDKEMSVLDSMNENYRTAPRSPEDFE